MERSSLCKHDEANFLSRTFLFWLNPTIKLANERCLNSEDLGTVADSLKASKLSSRFLKDYEMQEFRQLVSETALLNSLFSSFGYGFMTAGILKFVGDCAGLASPFVLKLLLGLIRKRNDAPEAVTFDDWKYALLLSGAIFALQVTNSLTVNMYFQRTYHCGFKIRVSLIDAMYRKALRLSFNSRQAFSASKIVNMISVDCQRIDLATSFLHYLWSGAFQSIVIIAFLFYLIGWSSLVGLMLFVLFFPIQGKIVAMISARRKKTSSFTDNRLKIMSELISGIKIIKTHAWEEESIKRIAEIRKSEIANVQAIQTLQAAIATITFMVPVIACIGTFITYRYLHGSLPMDLILPALAYFNLLRLPLVLLPVVIGFATDARVSLGRIAELFAAEEKADYLEQVDNPETLISISDACFTWSHEPGAFAVVIKQLEIQKGELLCIVGPIGSGKSTTLSGILGEALLRKGHIQLDKTAKIAYCPQIPWIITGTVRDNILFGEDFDEDWYEHVLDVCQLRTDLDQFSNGDATIIGERGTNLSGGQKQRISIARAVYSRAQLYIFDDPLSALDARVGNAIWEEVVLGVLADETRLVVTHSLRHSSGHRTMFVENGVIIKEEIASAIPRSITPIPSPSSEGRQLNDGSSKPVKTTHAEKEDDEERAVGAVSAAVAKQYSDLFGSRMFILLIITVLILNQGTKVFADMFLANEENLKGATSHYFALVYGMFGVLQGLLVMGVCLLFNYGATRAALKLHDSALSGLLAASLDFFEKTASGRILNRFSRDVDCTDNQIAECFRTVAMTAAGVLSTLALSALLAWPSFIVIIPAMFIFYKVQKEFRPPAREIKRLDSLSKAPVFSVVSESLNGLLTMRAFRKEPFFIKALSDALDKNGAPVFLYMSLQRWVSIRLEMIGNVLIFAAAGFAFVTADIFSFAGLSVVYALNTTGALNWLIRRFSEAEGQMIAVERLMTYSNDLPSETDTGTKEVPEDWPSQGRVEIKNLTISYRIDRPPALIDMNLQLMPGEHVGIVGRTGAGKSTIISAFFRLYNAAVVGSISIDEIDISSIPLKTLRRRLAIIPQDPILFSGTIRSNLDPFDEFEDADLWLALERSGFASILKRNPAGLDAVVDSQGENWSAGERQLLCLSRALLSKARVILMDEATSSVDPTTDAAIQECVATDMANSTVIIVAHRLGTIMHCSRVFVLDSGRIIEEGPPKLLATANGPFQALLDQQLKHSD